MAKSLMQYTIGTNFDEALLDFIKNTDLSNQVKGVYGKLPKDILGGGRTTLLSPQITLQDLRRYVAHCQALGLSFNYLLNGICSGNRELTPSGHRKLLELLYELCNMGITQVTVASPYLCELIKKQFPELKVTIGLYAYISHFQSIQPWIDLGADELTLASNFTRNFNVLRKLLIQYKNTPVNFRLIANNSCLHYCPYGLNHACTLSHSSQSEDESQCLHLDYNLLKCKYTEIKTPATLIASEWIRPEDVHYYTELCEETGNFNLSLKLVERTKNTVFLKQVLESYLKESFNGNLIDLLNWPSDLNAATHIDKKNLGEKGNRLGYPMAQYIQYVRSLTLPHITLDNQKLDGFLEHFIHHNHCDEHLCSLTMPSDKPTPNTCYHCVKWAKKVISYDSEEVDKWLTQVSTTFENMKTSKIFTDASH